MGSLQISGSFIIGGMLILSLMGLFFFYSSFSNSKTINSITQTSSFQLKQIVDYDFNKIGYRCNNQRISAIDSNSITFYADLDNNGVADNINYNFSKYLTRTVNPGNKKTIFQDVDGFRIQGFDSLNNATKQPALVKSISISITQNNQSMIADSTFYAVANINTRYKINN